MKLREKQIIFHTQRRLSSELGFFNTEIILSEDEDNENLSFSKIIKVTDTLSKEKKIMLSGDFVC